MVSECKLTSGMGLVKSKEARDLRRFLGVDGAGAGPPGACAEGWFWARPSLVSMLLTSTFEEKWRSILKNDELLVCICCIRASRLYQLRQRRTRAKMQKKKAFVE